MQKFGSIVQCIGAVVDIEFPRSAMPKIFDALTLDSSANHAGVEAGLTFEVQQQLGDGVVRTIAMGGVHLRERIWIVAANAKIMQRNGRANYRKHSKGKVSQFGNCTSAPDASHDRRKRGEGIKQRTVFRFSRFPWGEDVRRVEDLRSRSDLPEPLIRRINHDVAAGMDRLKAVGNGQVSRVAATAWRLLSQRFND